jgi:putative endonuclease
MVTTYLLKSELDDSYYVGITSDINKRVGEHNSGKSRSTARKRPWRLVFMRDHEDYLEARKHEKWLKKKNRDYKDKLAQLAPPGGVK